MNFHIYLHGNQERLGTVRMTREMQIKEALARTPEGIFAAGDVFNEFVLRRLGIEADDYVRAHSI